jgi:predicted Zn-dependent peptidase
MSSRLFQTVREKHGLCYSINSSYQLFEETGMFTISGGFDAARAEAALKLTCKEIRRIVDTKVTTSELKRAKDYLQGTFRLGLEGAEHQMLLLGSSILNYGRLIPPSETLAGIQKVTAEDVRAVAETVFMPTRMTLSLVVPKEQKQNEADWQKVFTV